MIKYICDFCQTEQSSSEMPTNWVMYACRFPDGNIGEEHYCSWECLAAMRKGNKPA
jgi:hypothetical protein